MPSSTSRASAPTMPPSAVGPDGPAARRHATVPRMDEAATTTPLQPPGDLPQIDLLNGHLYAADPTPTYRWLRHHAPVYHDDINDLWGISRYRDVVEVEKQTRRYSSRDAFRPLPVGGDY